MREPRELTVVAAATFLCACASTAPEPGPSGATAQWVEPATTVTDSKTV